MVKIEITSGVLHVDDLKEKKIQKYFLQVSLNDLPVLYIQIYFITHALFNLQYCLRKSQNLTHFAI